MGFQSYNFHFLSFIFSAENILKSVYKFSNKRVKKQPLTDHYGTLPGEMSDSRDSGPPDPLLMAISFASVSCFFLFLRFLLFADLLISVGLPLPPATKNSKHYLINNFSKQKIMLLITSQFFYIV